MLTSVAKILIEWIISMCLEESFMNILFEGIFIVVWVDQHIHNLYYLVMQDYFVYYLLAKRFGRSSPTGDRELL